MATIFESALFQGHAHSFFVPSRDPKKGLFEELINSYLQSLKAIQAFFEALSHLLSSAFALQPCQKIDKPLTSPSTPACHGPRVEGLPDRTKGAIEA